MGTNENGKICITACGCQIGIRNLTGIDGMKTGAAHQLADNAGNRPGFGFAAGGLKNADGF